MRDAGRFKERYDFSLDSRRLGLVLFAGLVTAVVVFVLGMSVGRQWERKLSAENPAVAEAPPVEKARNEADDVVPAAPPVEPAGAGDAAVSQQGPPGLAAPEPEKDEPVPETMKPEELTFPKVLTTTAKPETLKARPKPKKTVPPRGAYTVQVGAYKDKATADALVRRLGDKGYEAGLNASGGVYRVHVGSFGSKEDAIKMADRLSSSERLKPYVTTY